jgi:hypothetical protein
MVLRLSELGWIERADHPSPRPGNPFRLFLSFFPRRSTTLTIRRVTRDGEGEGEGEGEGGGRLID